MGVNGFIPKEFKIQYAENMKNKTVGAVRELPAR